ncbi:hypothetical protein B9K06_01825 [Bacillus sp. OG2]|nr:hypothetical protein B9K06_01825 [Bacillus sp. OG2]
MLFILNPLTIGLLLYFCSGYIKSIIEKHTYLNGKQQLEIFLRLNKTNGAAGSSSSSLPEQMGRGISFFILHQTKNTMLIHQQ